MAGSLEPVVAKLDRAAEHYRFLKEELFGGRDALLHPVTYEAEPDGLKYRLRVGTVEELDPRWPVIVGDAYFNLRATLDYVVYQLHVRHYGRGPVPDEVANRSAFPSRISNLTRSGNPIPPTIEWDSIGHLSKRDRAAIELLQPYNRGHKDGLDPLRIAVADIALMNNVDKHRELHVILSLPSAFVHVDFADRYGFQRDPQFGIPVVSDAYVDTWSFTEAPPAEQVKVNSSVLLTAGLLQDGQRFEALAHIGGCILAVWSIVQRFSDRFPPLATPPDFSWIRRSAKIT